MKLPSTLRVVLLAAAAIALLAAGAIGMRVIEGMSPSNPRPLPASCGIGPEGWRQGPSMFFAGSAAAASRSAFVLVSAADVAFRADNRKLADDLLTEAGPLAGDADARMMQRLKEPVAASGR